MVLNAKIVNKRDLTLDLMKLIGAFIVIGIHVFPYIYDMPKHPLYQLFILLGDPIFFFVSGYVYKLGNYQKKERIPKFLKNEIKLILFFIIYSLFVIIIKKESYRYFIDILKNPHKSLWFLVSLFCMRLIALLSDLLAIKIGKRNDNAAIYLSFTIFIIVIGLLIVLFLIFGEYFDIGHTAYYSIFFLQGMMTFRIEKMNLFQDMVVNKLYFYVLCILFATLFMTCIKNDILYSFGIEQISIRMITSFIGTYILFIIFKKISFFGKIIFSRYSIWIYFIHSLLIEIANEIIQIEYYHSERFLFFIHYYLLLTIMTLIIVSLIIVINRFFLKAFRKTKDNDKIYRV